MLTGIGGSLMFDNPISESLTTPSRTGWEPMLDRFGW
jgi:hypothetical protein